MQQQEELFQADFGWFHFFRQIIQNETWAKMSLAASKLYPVIKSYCNSDNGAAFPSYITLQEKSGLSKASITTALKELVKLDLLTEKKSQGKSTIYKLKETFEIEHPISGKEGTASFNYISKNVGESVNELKEFLKTGVVGKNITINLNILTGEHATGNITNNHIENKIDSGDQLENILQMLENKDKQPVDNL